MKTKEKLGVLKKSAISDAAVELSDEALDRVIGGIGRLVFSGGLQTNSENLQPAETLFSSADAAKEMTDLTKNNMLLQTAEAMLEQADQQKQGGLSLLQ